MIPPHLKRVTTLPSEMLLSAFEYQYLQGIVAVHVMIPVLQVCCWVCQWKNCENCSVCNVHSSSSATTLEAWSSSRHWRIWSSVFVLWRGHWQRTCHQTSSYLLCQQWCYQGIELIALRLMVVKFIIIAGCPSYTAVTVADRPCLLPLPVHGTVCLNTSRPHPLCLFF